MCLHLSQIENSLYVIEIKEVIMFTNVLTAISSHANMGGLECVFMRFNNKELIVIFKALKMNYLDGPDNEDHANQIEGLLNSIARHLQHDPIFDPYRQGF